MTAWVQFCAACAGLNKKRHTCDIPPPARKCKEKRTQVRVPGVFAPGYDGPPEALTEQHNDDPTGTIGNNGKLVGGHPDGEASCMFEDHFLGHDVDDYCEVDVFDHVRDEL